MAGDWVKMRVDLHDDPAVIAVAAALDKTEDEIVGKLLRLWGWADQQTNNGNARSVTRKWIDNKVGAAGFAAALEVAGWLVVSSDGITIPNFERHNGQPGKARALTAKRVGAHRAEKSNAHSVTKTLPEKRRGEERREEKNKRREEKSSADSASAESCPAGAGPNGAADKAVAASDIRAVFAHYRTYHPRACPKPNSKSQDWRLVLARLHEGYTANDLCDAIDGCHKSPHHCGKNQEGTKYQSLELIVRDSKHVAMFIEHATGEAKSGPVQVTREPLE